MVLMHPHPGSAAALCFDENATRRENNTVI